MEIHVNTCCLATRAYELLLGGTLQNCCLLPPSVTCCGSRSNCCTRRGCRWCRMATVAQQFVGRACRRVNHPVCGQPTIQVDKRAFLGQHFAICCFQLLLCVDGWCLRFTPVQSHAKFQASFPYCMSALPLRRWCQAPTSSQHKRISDRQNWRNAFQKGV